MAFDSHDSELHLIGSYSIPRDLTWVNLIQVMPINDIAIHIWREEAPKVILPNWIPTYLHHSESYQRPFRALNWSSNGGHDLNLSTHSHSEKQRRTEKKKKQAREERSRRSEHTSSKFINFSSSSSKPSRRRCSSSIHSPNWSYQVKEKLPHIIIQFPNSTHLLLV